MNYSNSISFNISNIKGAINFSTCYDIEIIGHVPTSSSDPQINYGALATNNGLSVFKNVCFNDGVIPQIEFFNVVGTSFNIVKSYTPDNVNYFFFFVEGGASRGDNIRVVNANTMSVSFILANEKVVDISFFDNNIFVITENTIEKYLINVDGSLDILGSRNIVDGQIALAACSDDIVVYSSLRYALNSYDFSSGVLNSYSYSGGINVGEIVFVNGYLVATDYAKDSSIMTKQFSTLGVDTSLSIQKLSQMNIGAATQINNFFIFGSLVGFYSVNGIAFYNPSLLQVSEFINNDFNYIDNNISLIAGEENNNSYLLITSQNIIYTYKIFEVLRTYSGIPLKSQEIFRDGKNGLKIEIVLNQNQSVANATINILDEKMVQVDQFILQSGIVQQNALGNQIGVGGKVCYFDAPFGITGNSFFVEITSDQQEEIKISKMEAI